MPPNIRILSEAMLIVDLDSLGSAKAGFISGVVSVESRFVQVRASAAVADLRYPSIGLSV
jgi:hypothetical protein